MFNIGPLELMVIMVIALLVVGPKRLPEVGKSIGKGLREFRRAQEEVRNTLRMDLELDDDEDAGSGGTPSVSSGAASTAADTPGSATEAPQTGNGEVPSASITEIAPSATDPGPTEPPAADPAATDEAE